MSIPTLSTTEAAALLGVSPRRVRAMITAGRLPADWDAETRMNRIPLAAVEVFEVKPRGRPKHEGG